MDTQVFIHKTSNSIEVFIFLANLCLNQSEEASHLFEHLSFNLCFARHSKRMR
jgi:hypothetical protein